VGSELLCGARKSKFKQNYYKLNIICDRSVRKRVTPGFTFFVINEKSANSAIHISPGFAREYPV
jgi:hypothetical protein